MTKKVLMESTKSNFKVLDKKPANVLKRIQGVLSDFKSNRNGRIYPRELWENVLNSDYVKEMIESHGLVGELDHPEERLEISLQNVSHVINDMWIEGDQVMGTIDILPTPSGKIVSELLDYGTDIGISSRGAGSVGAGNVVDPDYQFITFDFVARPSCEAARLNMIVEGVQVEIDNNSDDKVNSILESYKTGLKEGTDVDSYTEEDFERSSNRYKELEAIKVKSSGLIAEWGMDSTGEEEDTVTYYIKSKSGDNILNKLTYNVDNLGKMSDEEFENLKIKIRSELGIAISNNRLGVSRTCPLCNKEYIMYVDTKEYTDYINGAKVQDAFKDLNPMEREFIKSGYCPECQKQLFGTDYTSDKIIPIESAKEMTESIILEAAMSDQEVYKVVLGWYKQQIESGKMTLNQCYQLLSDKAKVSLNKMLDQSKIRESLVDRTIKELINESITLNKENQ